MLKASELFERAIALLPYEPLDSQAKVLAAISAFAVAHGPRDAYILNGYAGTGKTSIVGAMVEAMAKEGMKCVILAPTGRAAKVASSFANFPASTIHKRLFRGDSSDPMNATFFLAKNISTDTLFIVDEASLITDNGSDSSLLALLTAHVYSAPGCAMLLVGDLAQLPPVGQSDSPAMNPDRLRQLGLIPFKGTLDIPVRQASESGILHNATNIRNFLYGDLPINKFNLFTKGFEDAEIVSSSDLADVLSDSWREVGMSETIIITRSNHRANNFNRAIRNLVMGADEPLQRGDRIVISRNDYYWSKINKLKTFIANGDMAEVTWVGNTEKAYGRYFTDVELTLISDGSPVGAKIMLRSLVADGSSIPVEEMSKFYQRVLAADEGTVSERIKAAMEDPYYNALQAKYAYCVTCHKSQGGQWKHVYIDMAGIDMENVGSDFYRWLYTAVTRAVEKVFFINPPVRAK